MELRTVNTFLHIAELHSFSRTARQLGYSQSAVSSQIAQLEAELGTPLFDRVGKTVRLTDAGQTFLGYARTLLETAQQAQAALQPAQQVRGSLRIALADSVCSTFLPGLLQRYHARCPQVELVLHTASSDEMLQLLSTNQVDLVYTLDQPLLQPALVLAADVPEPVCFIAPPQHPLAQERSVPLDILPRQEFLLTERPHHCIKRRSPCTMGSPLSRSACVRPVTLAIWCCNLRKMRGRRWMEKVSSTLASSSIFTAPISTISPRRVCCTPW